MKCHTSIKVISERVVTYTSLGKWVTLNNTLSSDCRRDWDLNPDLLAAKYANHYDYVNSPINYVGVFSLVALLGKDSDFSFSTKKGNALQFETRGSWVWIFTWVRRVTCDARTLRTESFVPAHTTHATCRPTTFLYFTVLALGNIQSGTLFFSQVSLCLSLI